jgi:hypothetical protein
MSLLEVFCAVDDFWKTFEPRWRAQQLGDGKRHRQRQGQLHPSEIVTILIHFHQASYRTFKAYYTQYVQVHLTQEFPHLVSYQRFVELMPRYLAPLCAYLRTQRGRCTGISFIDSTSLAVCKNPRIRSHRVFAGRAARGKTSVGWFFGFKLHLVVNDRGDIIEWLLTPGNVHDLRPAPRLLRSLFGVACGDKGYLSHPLMQQLWVEQGLRLIPKLRAKMAHQLPHLSDSLLLRKRAIIECIYDQLKNQSQIEHSRHRSPHNFLVNLVAGLIAYCLQPKKPSLGLDHHLLLVA